MLIDFTNSSTAFITASVIGFCPQSPNPAGICGETTTNGKFDLNNSFPFFSNSASGPCNTRSLNGVPIVLYSCKYNSIGEGEPVGE